MTGLNFFLITVTVLMLAVLLGGEPDNIDLLTTKVQQAIENWNP